MQWVALAHSNPRCYALAARGQRIVNVSQPQQYRLMGLALRLYDEVASPSPLRVSTTNG